MLYIGIGVLIGTYMYNCIVCCACTLTECVAQESSRGHITVLFQTIVAIMSLPLVQVIRDRNNIIATISTQVRSVTFMHV